jgi:hypothetical protein
LADTRKGCQGLEQRCRCCRLYAADDVIDRAIATRSRSAAVASRIVDGLRSPHCRDARPSRSVTERLPESVRRSYGARSAWPPGTKCRSHDTALVAALGSWQTAPLVGWDAASLLFLVWMWRSLVPADPNETSRLATRENSSRPLADVAFLFASVASLVGVAAVLVDRKSKGGDVSPAVAISLGITTIRASLRASGLRLSGVHHWRDVPGHRHGPSEQCCTRHRAPAHVLGLSVRSRDQHDHDEPGCRAGPASMKSAVLW